MPSPITSRNIAGLPIIKVSEKKPNLKVLIYGASGVGKTYLSGTSNNVEGMAPTLFVDCESGTYTLRKDFSDVDTVRVTNWKELMAVMNFLMNEDHEYRTVVIDSLTEVQKFSMYFIMSRFNKDPLDEKAGWDEYNLNLEAMRRFVRDCRDLDMNVIFTSLLSIDKDAKSGRFIRSPLFTGKFKEEVAALLDEVFFYYPVEQYNEELGQDVTVRALLTSPTDTATAKDRSGMLDQVIVNPTMQILFDLMVTMNG